MTEHAPECELTVVQRGWWSITDPQCTCGAQIDIYRHARQSITTTTESIPIHNFEGWQREMHDFKTRLSAAGIVVRTMLKHRHPSKQMLRELLRLLEGRDD